MAYVTTGTAGKMLGVSRQRIHQLLSEGKLSAVMCDGRHMVSARSIEARLALLEQEAENYASAG